MFRWKYLHKILYNRFQEKYRFGVETSNYSPLINFDFEEHWGILPLF